MSNSFRREWPSPLPPGAPQFVSMSADAGDDVLSLTIDLSHATLCVPPHLAPRLAADFQGIAAALRRWSREIENRGLPGEIRLTPAPKG